MPSTVKLVHHGVWPSRQENRHCLPNAFNDSRFVLATMQLNSLYPIIRSRTAVSCSRITHCRRCRTLVGQQADRIRIVGHGLTREVKRLCPHIEYSGSFPGCHFTPQPMLGLAGAGALPAMMASSAPLMSFPVTGTFFPGPEPRKNFSLC